MMEVLQHKSSPAAHSHYGLSSPNEMVATVSNRVHHPLIFSLDDRLLEQHLTRLDLCSKKLHRIEKLPNDINFNVILLDDNQIIKLEHLDIYPQLIQLSASHNRLEDIHILSRVRSLQKLNLSYNLIDSIDCLRTLQNLVMLNISNNSIYSIAILNTCHSLQSLDASANAIQQIDDLSHLTSLKYLNLHKNFIDTLSPIQRHWPKSLHTLVISDNEIQDLTEVSYLSSFIDLNSLYIADNPCFTVVNERHGCHQPFDYRPYILNWCLALHNLDGAFITRKESLKAEWLLSQGKGRSFGIGEHLELVQYLTRVCGTDIDQRDDLHLSRIMLQHDLYNQQRKSTDEHMMGTSDTMKDASEISPKHSPGNSQPSTLTTGSDVLKLNVLSPTLNPEETVLNIYRQQMRTPSPAYATPTVVTTNHAEEQLTERSSTNRYSNYDNRPIRPLDQNMLQTKLNQYPIQEETNNACSNVSNKNQESKQSPPRLGYNTDRYSVKTTKQGPTTSSILSSRPSQQSARQRRHRLKRHVTSAKNAHALELVNHLHQNDQSCLTTAVKVENKEQQQPSTPTSNGNKTKHNEHDDGDYDDDEIQLKSAPVNGMLSTGTRTMSDAAELQRLTASLETMRTSVLQSYLQLNERFTKTLELQTSALSALWEKCEAQATTNKRESDVLLEENRRLSQRIRELETRLDTAGAKSTIESKPNSSETATSILHAPLQVHISKRDARSFFVHWIPNPLNERAPVIGYRIYINDALKSVAEAGQFEAVINHIREQGDYKIKVRAYNEQGESSDSNVVIARFRRHQPTTSNTETLAENSRAQSGSTSDNNASALPSNERFTITSKEPDKPSIVRDQHKIDIEQQQNNTTVTPERKIVKHNESVSPLKISPHLLPSDNISFKPPKSPNSSPGRPEKVSPQNASCSKALFIPNNNEISTVATTKHSPNRAGFMSRLARSPNRMRRNYILTKPASTEANKNEMNTFSAARIPIDTRNEKLNAFESDHSNSDQEHIVATRVPIRLASRPNNRLSTSSDTLSSNPSPSPPPIPPRISKTTVKILLDQ